MEFFTALFLGSIPGFVWLAFYVHEDLKTHRHKTLTALCFLTGMLTTFVVLGIQTQIHKYFPGFIGTSYSFSAFFVLAGIEEIVKFAGFFLVIRPQRIFQLIHEPIDGMIAMVTIALGFATVENIASVSQIIESQGVVKSAFENVSLRFLGATLLHTLSSGLLGYYWGKTMIRHRAGHHGLVIPLFVQGLFLATLLHAVFNFLIIINGPTGLAIVLLVFLAFFVLNDFEKLKHHDALTTS
jgi:protease PrsW